MWYMFMQRIMLCTYTASSPNFLQAALGLGAAGRISNQDRNNAAEVKRLKIHTVVTQKNKTTKWLIHNLSACKQNTLLVNLPHLCIAVCHPRVKLCEPKPLAPLLYIEDHIRLPQSCWNDRAHKRGYNGYNPSCRLTQAESSKSLQLFISCFLLFDS